jgi:PAS domain S-box-containing protein
MTAGSPQDRSKEELAAELEELKQRLVQLEERELVLSEAKYRALIEGSSDFIYVLDSDGHFTFANSEIEHLLGYTAEEIIGKHFSDVLHPEDSGTLGRAFHERRTGERASRRIEVRLNSRRGDTRDVEIDIRHFSISASGLYQDETFIGTHGVARDITERKYQETKRRALQKMRETVWSMGNPDDILRVLDVVRECLDIMQIDFVHCSVHVIDMNDPPTLQTYSTYESTGISKRGEWMVADEGGLGRTLVDIWQRGAPAYCRDLETQDTYQDPERIAALYGPVRAIIDVPFSHGTLTVCSDRPSAFPPRSIWFFQELAEALSEGFRRMEDLQQLAQSEQRYRTLVETPNFVVMLIDGEGNYLYLSPQIHDWLGYAPEDFYSESNILQDLVHPDDLSTVQSIYLFDQPTEPTEIEYRWRDRRGDFHWALASIFPIYENEGDRQINRVNLIQVVVQDITERRRAQEQIKTSLEEKEILLKEIHHRVKNNLQIVSGLLHLQSRHIQDEKILAAFDNSQHRIASMAMVHEELYRSQDLTRIDFSTYIHNLVDHLFESFSADTRHIALDIQIEDTFVEIDTAIPLGLIVNELVTNALKHAFPEDATGTIRIALTTSGTGDFTLIIGDDGKGLPPEVDLQQSSSLGLKLVDSLTSQLKATLEYDRSAGTTYTISHRAQ